MSIFRNVTLPDDDYVMEAAREALTHPPDSSFSDDDLFVTWGLTIGMHRDSDLVDVSNFERVTEDMRRVFPADVYVTHAGHWAVGWADQLTVRVLEPWADPYDYTARDVTRAFRVITSVAAYLREQYPVYDKRDLSEREHEAMEAHRADAWGDVVHQLWLLSFDDDNDLATGDDHVTEADRAVFDAEWERALDEYGYAEATVNPEDVVNKIMQARAEAAAVAERAAFEAANNPLPGL